MRIVHRPHFVRRFRERQWHPRFSPKTLAFLAPNRQPFLSIQPVHPLVVDRPPLLSAPGFLPAQKNVQPPVTEARALGRQFAQPGTQHGIVRLLRLVAATPSVHPDQPTGVSLAQARFFPHDTHRFSLRLRAYHFFDSTIFSASRSSACCATIFFSRPFSSSSWRNRRASFTSKPPYLAFQWYKVASLTPNRRLSSFTGTPDSASFNTATICSSLKRVFFIAASPLVPYTRRSCILAGLVFGGQVKRERYGGR